jgi:putative sigma-54 modulation protein
MRMTTTARHFEASDELIEHSKKKLRKLKRYFNDIINVDLVMSVEKIRHIAEVNVHVDGHDFTAKEESDNMYRSVDRAAKDLERQIKKFKRKVISNHRNSKNGGQSRMPSERIFDSKTVGKDGQVQLIESVPHDVPEYFIDEAIILMEKKGKNFIIFKNKESGNLDLAYRRDDGNYGVVGF